MAEQLKGKIPELTKRVDELELYVKSLIENWSVISNQMMDTIDDMERELNKFKKEYKYILKKLGSAKTKLKIKSILAWAKLFVTKYGDIDGDVDMDKEDYNSLVKAIDEDGNGRISLSEFKNAGNKLQSSDLDGNGVVTPSEQLFYNMFVKSNEVLKESNEKTHKNYLWQLLIMTGFILVTGVVSVFL